MRVPPARRDRRDRPVELPGVHADGLDRLRAGRRQRRGVQAERAHPRRRAAGWPTTFAEVVPEHPVLQVVTGLGETGAALCRSGVDKLAFTGSTATGKKVMAACAETLTPGAHRGRRQGRRARRRGRRRRRRRRRRALGRLLQRRPDLHRRRAGLRPRAGLRRVPLPAARQGAGPAAPTTPRRQDRPDHDARASSASSARTSTTPSTAAAGRVLGGPDAVGERYVQPTILVDVPEDSLGGAGGDLRPDRDRQPGCATWTRRSARPTPPATDWARRCSPRRAAMELAERIRSGMTAVNAVITFAGDPVAAVRRRRRLRLRPDPRPRRAQGVHLRQGDRPPAVQAGCWR